MGHFTRAGYYGYTICSLYANGKRVASVNGGGYDMKGAALGNYIESRFQKELCQLSIPMNRRNGEDIQEFYGLTFHDPTYNPGDYIPEPDGTFIKEDDRGKTVSQLEKEGKSLGLDRYQAFYRASSKTPTERHVIPLIDGACGFSSVETIIKALGYDLQYITGGRRSKNDIYLLTERGKV